MRQSSHAKESRDGRRAESFAELVCSFANDLEIAANGVHNETALDPWTVAVLRVFEDALTAVPDVYEVKNRIFQGNL